MQTDLECLYAPRSIAVVGASDRPGALGTQVFANLLRDYPGALYAVNPRRDQVAGIPVYPDLTGLPETVDLLVLMVPAEQAVEAVEAGFARGHRSALVITSGFREAGPAGAALQDRLTAAADRYGAPVVGPNCVGYLNTFASTAPGFMVQPTRPRPLAGPVAVISQSGGFGSFVLQKAMAAGLRVGFFATTGNECDVTVARTLSYAVEDPAITVLLGYVEAVHDGEVFRRAARRAQELGKAMAVVRPEHSADVARAVRSHTANVVGSTDVFDAVCRRYGVVVAESIEALVDCGLVLQEGKRMAGNRLGIMTQSGGAGVLMAGAAAGYGLSVPELPESEQRAIAGPLPPFASPRNPVDITAGLSTRPDLYLEVARSLIDSRSVDGLVVQSWRGDSPEVEGLVALAKETGKPLAAIVTLDPQVAIATGLATFTDPSRAVRAVAAVAEVSRASAVGRAVPAPDAARAAAARDILRAARGGVLMEHDAMRLLARYGVPAAEQRLVHSADEAAAVAERLAGRVALKIAAAQVAHKSELGGVRLGLSGAAAASAAFDDLLAGVRAAAPDADIVGVLIQRMVPAHLELAVGLTRDPSFGPVVTVGLGGTWVEMVGPPTLMPVPFGHAEALAAVRGLAGGRIMDPRRGLDDAAAGVVATVLVGLSELAAEVTEVTEVDINPLRVGADGVVAVDALVLVPAGSATPATAEP